MASLDRGGVVEFARNWQFPANSTLLPLPPPSSKLAIRPSEPLHSQKINCSLRFSFVNFIKFYLGSFTVTAHSGFWKLRARESAQGALQWCQSSRSTPHGCKTSILCFVHWYCCQCLESAKCPCFKSGSLLET